LLKLKINKTLFVGFPRSWGFQGISGVYFIV
jgi:hypothetical protein